MTPASQALEVDQLTIRYGPQTVVDDVTFRISPGSVYAILGRNGAGKSSLVRCIVGAQRPSSGTARIFGHDSWNGRANLMHRVAVVPEEPDAPPEMTAGEILQFCSRVYFRWNGQAAAERLAMLGIPLARRFGQLSKGEKRQVLLVAALACEPDLVILDDPTLGLDVVARKHLLEELIDDLARRYTTIFITTHDLSMVEGIASHVGILIASRLILDENLEALKRRFRRIRFTDIGEPVSDPELAKLNVVGVRRGLAGIDAVLSNFDDLAFERFRSTGRIRNVEVSPMSLEEIFVTMADDQGCS